MAIEEKKLNKYGIIVDGKEVSSVVCDTEKSAWDTGYGLRLAAKNITEATGSVTSVHETQITTFSYKQDEEDMNERV